MILPENTEEEMRLQSLPVQLSKKTANFSFSKEKTRNEFFTLSEIYTSLQWVWGTSKNGCNVTATTGTSEMTKVISVV